MTSAPDASRLAGGTRYDNANMLAYERYLRRAISEVYTRTHACAIREGYTRRHALSERDIL
jgi:hypothetical protein